MTYRTGNLENFLMAILSSLPILREPPESITAIDSSPTIKPMFAISPWYVSSTSKCSP